jgi:hypothetical protein
VIEPRKDAKVPDADAVGRESGRQYRPERKREFWEDRRGRRAGHADENFSCGNREISRLLVGESRTSREAKAKAVMRR